MDKKSSNRFQSFCNSLSALSEIRRRDLSDSFVLSGAGAKFSITFDLSWKVMKDILIQEFMIVDFIKGSPRDVLRQAYACRLISDDVWMRMLRDRNELTHDYDGLIVEEVCERLISTYLELLEEFKKQAGQYYEDTDVTGK